MAYCYECGSQVAEIDVFCPFCGISLKPVTVGGGDDASMDKTIIISGGESSALIEQSVSEPIEITQTEQIAGAQKKSAATVGEEAEMPKEFGKSTADFEKSVTEENFDLETDSIELPLGIIQNQTSSVIDNQQTSDAADVDQNSDRVAPDELIETPPQIAESKESEPQISQIDDSALPEPKHIEILKPIQEASEIDESETAKTDFNENPVVEIAPPQSDSNETAETESNFADHKTIENEPIVEIIPQIATENVNSAETFDKTSGDENLNNNIDHEIAVPAAESAESAVDEPTELSQTESFDGELGQDNVQTMIHPSHSLEFQKLRNFNALVIDESQNSERASSIENLAKEPPISKPEINLEEAETPQSAAMFDSVQIVQTEKREVEFEEKVAAIEAESLLAVPLPKSDAENQSYTTPNIGVENTDGKKGSKLKPLDEGTVLNNRYEIVRKIGGGGMGAVYLASDKNLGGVLRAVKEMVQSYIEEVQQDKAVNDFKRESLLLTSLEHTAIPTIYDYFFDEKEARFYLVMKYISGGDLAGRLRSSSEGRVDEQTVTEWGIQIADVLDYLHNREPSIVYRDLKPANIMIDGNSGRLMLIDFGIARWINKEEKGVTAVGTMGYAPPELFSGNVEARSDIYSLGSTMFHLLTGADPQSNPLLIFDFQKNPRPRQINSQLSDQIERILMRSVEYSADKRFDSAAELKKSLEEHLEKLKAGKVSFGVKETPASQTLSEQLVFCGFCGQKIVASDMFCAFCGAKQPLAQHGIHASPYTSHSATAKLILLNTEEFDAPSFLLEKEVNIVGRRDPMSNIFPEVDLSKFDPQTKISRRHARIWREENDYMVEDLGSSNGTILQAALKENVRLLPHQPHVLTNGDKIKVGDTTMSFNVG